MRPTPLRMPRPSNVPQPEPYRRALPLTLAILFLAIILMLIFALYGCASSRGSIAAVQPPHLSGPAGGSTAPTASAPGSKTTGQEAGGVPSSQVPAAQSPVAGVPTTPKPQTVSPSTPAAPVDPDLVVYDPKMLARSGRVQISRQFRVPGHKYRRSFIEKDWPLRSAAPAPWNGAPVQ